MEGKSIDKSTRSQSKQAR